MTSRRSVVAPGGCAPRSLFFANCGVFSFILSIANAGIAEAGLPFLDESQSRGINYVVPLALPVPPPFGHGLAFADLDSDGDPDLVTTGAENDLIGVFENTGGSFVSHTATSGIPVAPGASSVVAFDFDGDSDLDLFISQWNYSNMLLRNDGGFSFTDVSAITHIAFTGPGTGNTIGDYDGDGWLDVFVSNYGAENKLYRNMNGQAFEEVSHAVGVTGVFNTLQTAFFDMDMDGDKDIYVSNDQRNPSNVSEYNRLFENVNGVFTEISAQSGANIGLNSMNIGLADLDNNGFLDIYCTNWSIPNYGFFYPCYLLMNNGNGTFTQQQQAAGVESFRFGWGAVFLDFDNNKTLDLYVCNQEGLNRFYVNKGFWPLVDEASDYNVALAGDTRCVAVADVDADGDLDMAVQEFGANIHLFINQEGNERNWLKIRPVGLSPNRQSIGAVVRVRTEQLWQTHEIVAGSNFKVQNELVAQFGVDGDNEIDEVTVTWYDGATRTLTSLAVNQTHTIYHPTLLGDVNEDGVVDATELSDFVDALLFGGSPEPARFDFNGNGALEGGDIQGMMDRLIGA
ncbi:MAG TPA: CRTAC1 family protein [Phycisphaerae bacterium]|nr:CRTAC1 family protein [Phycisphaerae bacterium]HRW53028.1 CRTAC1 family protein [Phycisphaerae bacterium]